MSNIINVKHKGVLVTLSNQKFIIPPLTIHSLKILDDDIKKLQTSQSLDSLDSFLNILTCALKRNYP